MKRVSILVMSLILIASNLSAEITFTAFDAGGGKLTIGYQSTEDSEFPVGIALHISLSNGATIYGVDDVLSVDSHFPVYLDYCYSHPMDYNIGDGHPLAAYNQPGIPTFPSTDFSLCLGAFTQYPASPTTPQNLNGDSMVDVIDIAIFSEYWLSGALRNQSSGDYESMVICDFNGDAKVDFVDYAILAGSETIAPNTVLNLITLQLHDGGAGYTDVTIEGDRLRGRIPGTNGSYLDIVLPEPIHVVIPEPTTLLIFFLGTLTLFRKRKS